MIKRLLISLLILISSVFLSNCKKTKTNIAADQNAGTSAQSSIAQVPKITSSADKNKVHTGDIIKLNLKYYIPEGSTFVPEKEITGLEGLSIVSREINKNEIKLNLIIDKTESFDIGPVSLSFKDKKGDLNIIRSEKIRIEVLSNLGSKPAEAQLKPIMDIIPTYPLWLKLLPWVLGILLLSAIGAGLYYHKKRKRQETERRMSIKPPHVIAKEELEKLKFLNLIEKGEYKEFYFRFSEILRQYLEKLRNFPAVELTTEEISRRIRDEKDRKLMPLLREADLVKFADAIPTKAKNEEEIGIALEYIRETTPVQILTDSIGKSPLPWGVKYDCILRIFFPPFFKGER
jgi:hypothetical protein